MKIRNCLQFSVEPWADSDENNQFLMLNFQWSHGQIEIKIISFIILNFQWGHGQIQSLRQKRQQPSNMPMVKLFYSDGDDNDNGDDHDHNHG